MSFSQDVKKELFQSFPKARHCQIAELAAIVTMIGEVKDGKFSISTENEDLRRKFFTLLNKTITINGCENTLTQSETKELFEVLKMRADDLLADGLITQQSCCKRAFVRGAFLASGSVSDPKKGYHFEVVCNSFSAA